MNQWPSRLPPVQRLGDYRFGRHMKSYLQHMRQRCGLPIKDLMTKVGYTDERKFLLQEREWLELRRKIPLSYLEAIGAERANLEELLTYDREDFEQAQSLPLTSGDLGFRVAGMAGRGKLSHVSLAVFFGELKTLLINPWGEVYTEYREPKLLYMKAHVSFGWAGK